MKKISTRHPENGYKGRLFAYDVPKIFQQPLLTLSHRCGTYRVFHEFEQAKSASGGSVSGSNQFILLP